MNNRERALAILNYQSCDRTPVVHFGFWRETLEKWLQEGHISEEEFKTGQGDHSPGQRSICDRLGFDFGWGKCFAFPSGLMPIFESQVIEEMPDGSRKMRNADGVIILQSPEAGSIPAEFDHLLKDRKSWEEHFKPRLQKAGRVNEKDGKDWVKAYNGYSIPQGAWCGSMLGTFRNWVGMENLCYLQADDPDLFKEIIDTVGDLAFHCLEGALRAAKANGFTFDFGHMWEDICFKNGPLISPSAFREHCGPHYKRISGLLRANGIKLLSLDCDGWIDALIPTWIENGVNVMFPIEVGTWNASIKPWREKYGREIRGVGGMDKKVFAYDKAAIDAEIERLKPLVALGGFIPCPDHRIPPDAKWELVQYYCEQFRKSI